MADEYMPDVSMMDTIVPAILGLTAAAVLSTVACICAKQMRIRNKKQNHHDASFPFQPTRRPTAVRSPSGQPPHYLKKSPSPTGGKQMGLLSPMQDQSTSPIAPQNVKYTEEDEVPMAQQAHHQQQSSKLNVVDNVKQHNHHHHSPVETIANGNVTITLDESMTNGKELTITDQYGKLGTIYFKLRYLAERNALMVSIIRCRGLPCKGGISGTGDIPTGMNGRTQAATDPYVKLQLLPDKQHKVKTRVVRNTRNPVYDEDFTFYGLNMNDLQNMSLHFVILSFDRYSRDDVIGEVVCPLSSIEIGDISKEALSISKEIQPRSLKIRAQGRGELLISLCWQPAAGRLTVVLLKARNLPRMDVTGLADPYVKIYLLYNGQRIAKKKTHVKKRTLSPVFNESFAFDIPAAEGTGASLEGVSLELMLLDWDRVTKNEVIGRLELGGPTSSSTALNHWNEVCNSPRRQIAEWHKLNE
ncbi:synaptotagmin-4 [Drosophila nasuta]|uniref:Synaptotagmin-4 n=1 Tax=Drosophila albomicans TaxID=7291 RepID=A0A6P8XRL9_DROAB|nr:synaptotagmin-4 [Drosophila albomicans]XP_060648915.1 synaptotagmin-4 [Drosophila nasuta]